MQDLGSMIRFLCLNTFIVVYSILFCLWSVLLSFFDPGRKLVQSCVHRPWARGILWVCGIKVQAGGMENVKGNEPCIYMSNHQSYFDIFVLLAFAPTDFRFILKQELMKIPFLGVAMKRAGHIAINRESPREAIRGMEQVAELIKSGMCVVIFPEGTRSVDGKLQPLKKGGFHMAIKSGRPIVPVAIRNTCRIVTKGSLRINKGDVAIYFDRPISLEGYTRKNLPELMDRVKTAIQNHL